MSHVFCMTHLLTKELWRGLIYEKFVTLQKKIQEEENNMIALGQYELSPQSAYT